MTVKCIFLACMYPFCMDAASLQQTKMQAKHSATAAIMKPQPRLLASKRPACYFCRPNFAYTAKEVEENVRHVFQSGFFQQLIPKAEDTRDGVKLTLEVGSDVRLSCLSGSLAYPATPRPQQVWRRGTMCLLISYDMHMRVWGLICMVPCSKTLLPEPTIPADYWELLCS